jgi:hypothetical protein
VVFSRLSGENMRRVNPGDVVAVGTPRASSPWRYRGTLGLCALAGAVASFFFARETRP